ncbi:hypothetical protein NQ315_003167 [Exocentrus adspersus]|uniref:Uncharacterized protein n=1 Tax=Exocentrus adspersus TaxID=1586481 RepID=A0AAV8W5W2_9CUCU|nr:hypothetical protein NQ315_003167 [Exocentrus adspersus]
MVLETRHRNSNNKERRDSRCRSADSGVSVALNKNFTFTSRILRSSPRSTPNDLEELDFEPEGENGFDNNISLNPSESEFKQHDHEAYSDQSTIKNLDIDFRNNSHSAASVSGESYNASTISIAHQRDMLPVPSSNAVDGRQSEYLSLSYPPSLSTRTILDSSSSNGSDTSEENIYNIEKQEVSEMNPYHCQLEGSLESDDNSSNYSINISQEEEDILLEGSSDEEKRADDEEEPPDVDDILIPTGLVTTCKIGNARITLPTFVTRVPIDQTNDLKRTKSTARLKMTAGKKKKWDQAFSPKNPIKCVCLNDVGYVPECFEEEDNTSEQGAKQSRSPTGNLIVICNKDKITCEQSPANIQRDDNIGMFKLPLPPPKRPPTRPKRTVSNSNEYGRNLKIQVFSRDEEATTHAFAPKPQVEIAPKNISRTRNVQDNADKDDALSIIASSIGIDNMDDDIAQMTDNLDDSAEFEHSIEEAPSRDNVSHLEQFGVVDRIQQWVNNVPDGQASTSGESQTNLPVATVTQPNPKVNAVEPPSFFVGAPRINYREVPFYFTGLCFSYFLSGKCMKQYCKLPHVVDQQKFAHKLMQRGNLVDLLRGFQFSMNYEKLFTETYPVFLNAFGMFKMENDLYGCIKDILKMKSINSVEAVNHVVNALENCGLSFQEAIENISFNVGFLEHPELADILLEIIVRKPDIAENWEVIKRIARARGQIKSAIVTTILMRLTSDYPVNRDLCLQVYNVIIKNNMTDLSLISENLLTPFRTLVGFPSATGLVNSPPKTVPYIHALPVPSSLDSLAAHIDMNLIRERQRYERDVETSKTTVRNPQPLLGADMDYRRQRSASLENRSHSSGSEEQQQYFTLSPLRNSYQKRPSPYNMKPSQYTRNDSFSPATSKSNESEVDYNAALKFVPPPPSDISEYQPQTISKRPQPQPSEINLLPSRPIFGKPSYRNGFSFKSSLHNLLPDPVDNVNINERDVTKLNAVIKQRNGPEFYKLLRYYENPPTLRNFITMAIADLKCGDIYETLVELVKSMELVDKDYTKDALIKGVVEVIVLNLLFELERKCKWQEAMNMLQLFCDWDSLISSQIFAKRKLTHMGRYIFLAKVFAKAKNFHLTYEILQCPSLKLLESLGNWPYFKMKPADLESRNAVLKEFFEYGHHHCIVDVSDMYRRVFKFGAIHGYDASRHFNPMLISVMNERADPASHLKHFHPDIDIYYKIMDKNVLRAFSILLADRLSQEQCFKLYELCCERQIYTLFTGAELTITVRNNMLDVELQLILNYYFHKMMENRQMPQGNIRIEIRLLENKALYPKILQKCVRSIQQINETIKEILEKNFRIFLTNKPNDQMTIVDIPYELIMNWQQCNQRWFPVYFSLSKSAQPNVL